MNSLLILFQLHGFPDLSMGWRYQIPMLADMGLRVIAPDCLGYGRTVCMRFGYNPAIIIT